MSNWGACFWLGFLVGSVFTAGVCVTIFGNPYIGLFMVLVGGVVYPLTIRKAWQGRSNA